MVYYTSGTAVTEQDIVGAIETFLTTTIGGWVKIGTITDASSDKDLVFYSKGSVPGRYQDIYMRWRGYSDYIYTYGYSLWVSAVTYSDEIHDASYTRMPVGGTNMEYWLFGTRDWLWVVVKNSSDSALYSCYGGYILTYYSASDDTLPIAVVGQTASSYSFANNRCYMYAPVVSGTVSIYKCSATESSNLLTYGDPNTRDGSQAHVPLVLYNATEGYKELRGELEGSVRFSGATLSSEDWVVISGTGHKFFVQRYDDNTCFGFGPIPV